MIMTSNTILSLDTLAKISGGAFSFSWNFSDTSAFSSTEKAPSPLVENDIGANTEITVQATLAKPLEALPTVDYGGILTES